jgi:foldase protein PrsA
MPRAKKVVKKTKKSDELFEESISPEKSSNRKFNIFWILVPAALVGLGILAYVFKAHFIAAIVNGQIISSSEVNNRLNKAYRKAILEEIVNETILEQEARKNSVSVSVDEIEAKLQAEEETYGGKEVFESLLSQQGLTREDYSKRIRLVLIMEKLYGGLAIPNDQDIKQFMEQNANLPEATDESKFKELAKEQVKQQKLSEIISTKFPELKASSSIQVF